MNTLPGRETVTRIKSCLENSDFASVTRLIEMIRDLSRGIDATGVDQLADLIRGEVGFTAKVIKAAQPMRYNPEGVQVETISQAIQVVGLDRVRNVSISLLMGEDNRESASKLVSSEVNTLALSCGMFAKSAAEFGSYSDPNLCFVSGLLQNYGLILTSKFFPDYFLEFKKQEYRYGTEEAHNVVFGISQLDLAREILKWQKMPPSILKSMRIPSRSDLLSSTPGLEMQPLLAGHFGKEASYILSIPHLTRQKFENQVSAVLGKFSRSIPMDHEEFKDVLLEMSDDFRQFRVLGDAKGFSDPIIQRIEILSNNGEDEPPITALGSVIRSIGPIVITPEISDQTEPDAEKSRVLYARSIRDLTAISQNPTSTLADVGAHGLETAMELHRADAALLFLLNPTSKSLDFKAGIGPKMPDTDTISPLPYNQRNIYSVCIDKGQNIFLEKPSSSTAAKSFPDWLSAMTDLEPFIFTPLYFVNNKVGIMLFIGGGAYSYQEYQVSSSVTIKYAQVLAHHILKKSSDESQLVTGSQIK
ncbi:MAG: HDOD domain-containing protein [Verrucomicrobia bacterium]|nr:HDOD domain-containing protein [Verrucomicrobiota bacterium]